MYSECNFGKNRTYAEVCGGFLPALKGYYASPRDYWLEPFRIFGNLYYVGDKKVCMHLIDTGEGLILLDTGYRHAVHLLLENIRSLNFSPEDIKYVIHSHGHFDHFGGGNEIRRLCGARVFMSAVDTRLLRERPERALMDLGPIPDDEICWPDEELSDGDVISLGNTAIRCVLTPGHTMGTMTFFFDVTDGRTVRKVACMGGVGFLSVYKKFCRAYGLPENKCELMRRSIVKVWDESADIVLGNHPNHNCTLEKRQWMLDNPGTNPFINPEAWRIFLTALEARRASFEALGY